jgi:WD40 repeat protein
VSDTFRAGIVRVQGTNIGAGFILSPFADTFLIITCTHVLGRPLPSTVTVTFSPSQETREVPVDPTLCNEHLDVALLRLEGSLPEKARHLPLGSSEGLHRHPIRTFGFPLPDDYVEGRWGHGTIDGSLPFSNGYQFLQISSDQITQGFSGSAVWDEDKQMVVGMVIAFQRPDEWGKGGNDVYAIPTETLHELFPDIKLKDRCPYQGLHPFREQDAAYFFGREQCIEELLFRLKEDKRLLAILGPIGSGKTSVVQAGLIPQLHQNGLLRSERWAIRTLPTTQDPFDPFSLQAHFGTTGPLIERIRYWRKEHPDQEHLILIFDHFEHIFASTFDGIRQSFLDEVVKLIENNLATIILIMRDTYYSILAEHTVLIKLVERHLCNIPDITDKNILSIIQGPAAIEGIHFEEGLASVITQDVTGTKAEPIEARHQRHSAILPSLSFCLQELWERRVDNTLTFLGYQSLGGVFGALPTFADRTYYALTESQQRLARRILTDLVSLGDDHTGRLDRRVRKPLSELCRQESETADAHEIVEAFAKGGLLESSFDDAHQEAFIQIIHEMLLWEWSLLRNWLHEDRQFVSWHHETQRRAQQWSANHSILDCRDQNLLLGRQDLAVANTWLEERAADIHPEVRAFIRASNLFFEYEEQRRRRFEEARQQQHIAQAKQLAAQAQLVERQEPPHIQRSLLLAVEALRRYPCLEADQAVRRGLDLLPVPLFRLTCPSPPHLITFGVDNSTLAIADHTHVLWTHTVSQLCRFKRWLLPEATSIALSDDGYYLLAAGKDSCAWLIDTVQERPLLLFPHTQQVRAVALTHLRPYLAATASDDTTVGIWDIPDASQFAPSRQEGVAEAHRRHVLRHGGAIRALAFSPDNRYVATVCADQKARIWDVTSGALLHVLDHQRPINIVTFSPDGTLVAFADDDHLALIWQWEQKRRGTWGKKKTPSIYRLSHQGVIHALAFSPDGKNLLTASDDATARIWALTSGNESQEIQRFEHQGPIKAACFHPEGLLIATASEDHTARIWDIRSGQATHYLPHKGPVTDVAFHPRKPYVVTSSSDGDLIIWETERSSLVTCFELEGHVKDLFIGTMYGKYHLRVALEVQNRLQINDLIEGNHVPATVFQSECSPGLAFTPDGHRLVLYDATAIVFSSDGRFIATAHENEEVKVCDTRHEHPSVSLPQMGPVHALMFSANGRYLAIASRDGSARIWEWRCNTKEAVVQLPHPSGVNAVTFTPDSSSVVTICEDNRVRIWKWKESNQRQIVDLRHQGHVHQALISPTDHYLLTVSQEYGAKIWDIATGLLISYKKHQDTIRAATFSADSAYVATASSDGTAAIWETETDRQLACLKHQGCVHACAFSPDGKYLATVSNDHRVCVWLWRPEDLILEANRHLTRNLSEEEWQLYIGNEPYRKTCLYLGWRESSLNDFSFAED